MPVLAMNLHPGSRGCRDEPVTVEPWVELAQGAGYFLGHLPPFLSEEAGSLGDGVGDGPEVLPGKGCGHDPYNIETPGCIPQGWVLGWCQAPRHGAWQGDRHGSVPEQRSD